MTIDRAAASTDVSRRTLYYWMAAGLLPFTMSGLSRHVALDDIERLKQSKGQHNRRPTASSRGEAATCA